MYSLIIPVYKNEASIPDLLRALRKLDHELDRRLEVVFVVDGALAVTGSINASGVATVSGPGGNWSCGASTGSDGTGNAGSGSGIRLRGR